MTQKFYQTANGFPLGRLTYQLFRDGACERVATRGR
jgi:hypothetical protein